MNAKETGAEFLLPARAQPRKNQIFHYAGDGFLPLFTAAPVCCFPFHANIQHHLFLFSAILLGVYFFRQIIQINPAIHFFFQQCFCFFFLFCQFI